MVAGMQKNDHQFKCQLWEHSVVCVSFNNVVCAHMGTTFVVYTATHCSTSVGSSCSLHVFLYMSLLSLPSPPPTPSPSPLLYILSQENQAKFNNGYQMVEGLVPGGRVKRSTMDTTQQIMIAPQQHYGCYSSTIMIAPQQHYGCYSSTVGKGCNTRGPYKIV